MGVNFAGADESATPFAAAVAEAAEPIKSKVAYQDYLALGPGRSPVMLHQQYIDSAERSGTKPYATLAQVRHWSKAHSWDERIIRDVGAVAATVSQAAELNKLDLLRVERAVKIRQIEEWDEVQTEHRSRMVDLGRRLLERAEEMLEVPLFREEVEDDGQTIVKIPVKWGPADVARYVGLADKVIRLAAEMDTSRARLTVDENRAKEFAEKHGLSADDVIKRAEEIVAGGS